MSLLIVGCGYVGQALVRWRRHAEVDHAQPIFALTRTPERADLLQRLGVEPVLGNWLQPQSLPPLPPVREILVSVPHRPDASSGLPDDSDQHHVLGLTNLRQALAARGGDPGQIVTIYLSTTGVFGATGSGEVVDESSPVSPTRAGPRMAVAAERWLSEHGLAGQSTVLRLAGIYGPGRIPLAQTLRQGQPLAVPREGFLNLIHVADVARAIDWLFRLEEPAARRSLYHLSDNHPVRRDEFYRYLAALCGLAEPQFTAPGPESSKLRRATDKRVDSRLFWNQSGLQPLYPDYRSGLRASLP